MPLYLTNASGEYVSITVTDGGQVREIGLSPGSNPSNATSNADTRKKMTVILPNRIGIEFHREDHSLPAESHSEARITIIHLHYGFRTILDHR